MAAATVALSIAFPRIPPSVPLRPVASPSLSPQPLPRIPPGTPLPDHPPDGWTHIILKSRSTLASGEVDKLHPLARSTAALGEFLFHGILARVAPKERSPAARYCLDSVAIGLAAEVAGQDTVISSQTAERLAPELGPLKRTILKTAEGRLEEEVSIAASDGTVIFQVPADVFFQGEVRQALYRYAVLVDPAEGRLATVVWRVATDRPGPWRVMDPTAVRLEPNLVTTCRLHVDGRRVVAGIPTPSAFAVTGLPPGEPLEVPVWFFTEAATPRFEPAAFQRIDAALRRAVGFSPGPGPR